MFQAAIQNFRDQPPQLFKLCLVEMWERFGFVTMAGVKVLFLVSPAALGGLGWSNSDALMLMAYYAVFLFMAPLLGGWLGDRFLGPNRAIVIGGFLMAAGYLCLGLLPYTFSLAMAGAPGLDQIVADANLALAQWSPDPEGWRRVAVGVEGAFGARAPEVLALVRSLYDVQTIMLGASLVLIVTGNALLKPSVSAIVGLLYSHDDPRRDGGFTLFWTCINAGAFLAYIIGGGLSERFGWNIGFFAAFAGMVGGLVYFLSIQKQLPTPPKRQRPVVQGPAEASPAGAGKRVGAILLMTAFAIIFNANHGQILGLIGLFVLQDVDRVVAGFQVPTLWVTSLNPLVILLAAPLAAVLWDVLGKRGRNPSFVVKFAMALFLLAAGELVLVFAAMQADGTAKAALAVLVVALITMSIAEIPLQPIGLSMVTALAPARLVGLMIGVWLLNYAIAGGIGNAVGSLASSIGLQTIFAYGAGSCILAGLLLLALRRPLERWMEMPARPRSSEPAAEPDVRDL